MKNWRPGIATGTLTGTPGRNRRTPEDVESRAVERQTAHPGAVAQLGERLLCKQEVVGSIPIGSIEDSGLVPSGPAGSGTGDGRGALDCPCEGRDVGRRVLRDASGRNLWFGTGVEARASLVDLGLGRLPGSLTAGVTLTFVNRDARLTHEIGNDVLWATRAGLSLGL